MLCVAFNPSKNSQVLTGGQDNRAFLFDYNHPEQKRELAGHTSWLEELSVTAPRGYALMRTTVSFINDFVALGAMNCALEIIDWSIDPDSREAPDVDGMIALLAAM